MTFIQRVGWEGACAQTLAMCGGTCACEKHSETCVLCVCVQHFFMCGICDRTFVHFLHQTGHKLLLFDFLSHPRGLKKNHRRISKNWVQNYYMFDVIWCSYKKNIINYKRCGCEVRPPWNESARMCACVPKSGRAMCVHACDAKNCRNPPFAFIQSL